MSGRRITRALRQRVLAAFHHRCAYCHSLAAITGARLVVDHIIPIAAAGETIAENLCPSCHTCNEFKGAQMDGRDPQSGKRVALYHPLRQDWNAHFEWSADASHVAGRTATGRATIATLNMNHPTIVEARRRWTLVGWHPPAGDRVGGDL